MNSSDEEQEEILSEISADDERRHVMAFLISLKDQDDFNYRRRMAGRQDRRQRT